MHSRIRPLLALAALVLLVAACKAGEAPSLDATAATPVAGSQDQLAALGLDIDPATFVATEFSRTGGPEGYEDHAQLFLDGHVRLERKGQEPVTFELTPAEIAQINAAFESADFHRNAPRAEVPESGSSEVTQYRISQRGILLRSTLTTQDGSVPDWAEPLLPLLENVLLTPRSGPLPAGEDGQEVADASAGQAAPVATQPVLVEFHRSGGPDGVDERVLVQLDRTYSVARDGVVEAGRLTEEEMAGLLQLLEAANLRQHQGEYLPEDTCCDRYTYKLTYRNLLGAYRITGMDGGMPSWLQVIVDTLVDAFINVEQLAAAPTPGEPPVEAAATPTSAPAATPVAPATTEPRPAEAPTEEATSELAALPAEAPVDTATATEEPTATATMEPSPTFTAEPTATATEQPTATPEPSPTFTAEPTATATEEPTATPEPSPTFTAEPTATATEQPAATSTATQEPTATPESSPIFTAEPTATATEQPAATSTATQEPTATPEPSPTFTAEPTATATEEPTATSTATQEPTATPEPSPTFTAEPTATATEEPTATPEPSPAPSPEGSYSQSDFVADIVNRGVELEVSSGRVVKPYLSAYGNIVWIEGRPVQVFEYSEPSSLAADLTGLAADASRVDGHVLSWQATPHFWRQGRLLVLAVSEDPGLVQTIDDVLGPPFAEGR